MRPEATEASLAVERPALESRPEASASRIAPAALSRANPRTRLSFAQQRLWFLDQLHPESALYSIPVAVRLRGKLDLAILHRSIDVVLKRHEILRTRFACIEGEPWQEVFDALAEFWSITDLSALANGECEHELQRRLAIEACRPFDLSGDVLLRTQCFQLAENEHVLFVNMHHIASDAFSFELFFNEVIELYQRGVAGEAARLPDLPVQYHSYAAAQRQRFDQATGSDDLGYWKRQLAEIPDRLELPADRARPSASSFRGGHCSRELPASLVSRLKELCRGEGVTPFILGLTAFNVLLHRLTQQEDIPIGVPMVGRQSPETQRLIGFFSNTLVLRSRPSGALTVRELLRQIRATAFDAYAHQELPFEKLVEAIQPNRAIAHAPLFQVMFVLQPALGANVAFPGLETTLNVLNTGTAKFDLTLTIHTQQRGWTAEMEFNSDLFDAATIERWLGHLEVLLNGAVANPECRLQELPWWTEPERRRLLIEWNQTQRDYPRNACIHELFEGHVHCAPERVAVVFGTRQLTFAELNARANQLAHRLRQLGLKAGEFVGISAERSLELIIGLVAILKAGGAYAALDPNLPALRLADLLNDLGCNVVLTQQRYGKIFSEASHLANPQAQLQTFWLDSDWPTLAGESAENLSCEINALRPAYVSFTSGSTGRPKGVCVPHRGVVRLVRNTNYAHFSPDEVFLQLAPVAFDASTLEIWGALLNGARVVVLPPGTPTLTELAETIQDQRVTIAFLTSGYFNQIIDEKPEALKPIRQVLTGGEALSLPHAHKARVMLPGCRLIHCYGPTENTTFTTCHDIPANFDGKSPVPIGRPISNTECYVLDSARQPVPIGVPGELYVGGDGLALGYLNRPELTAERFIEHPFRAGARLYKTGDRVRYLADGNIEFCGRLDFQLKIRGFRVEPAEIEAALLQHPEASQCIVIARTDASGQKHLVAYIVPRGMPSLEPAEWQNYLRQRLPEYMVPAHVVTLAELPLLSNGKVNRSALPLPKAVTVSSDRRLVPLDAIEQQLLALWQEVLATRPMGLNENFFALGGHSLLAVRLLARIEKSLGKKLSVAVLFQNPTIEQLAKLLRDEHPAKAGSAIVEIQAGGTQRPLFLVHGVGGGMFWGYANLARHLGPDQPVFALQSRSANGEAEFETIEAMAQSYLENVRAFQPSGPYYLGGYCFGGIVAFEMARRLQQQGEEVALLALINSAPPNSSYTKPGWRPSLAYSFARNACVRVVSSLRRPPEERRALFSWRAKSLAHRLRQKFFVPATSCSVSLDNWVDLSDVPENERALWRTHICALKHYQPQLYPGVVTLFRSPVHLLFCSFDSHYGWRELAAGGVTMRIIPGAHESIMQEPRVQLLATELRACLQTAQAKTR